MLSTRLITDLHPSYDGKRVGARLPDEFVHKIAGFLEEEEMDIYTLTLYSLNSNDMEYFDEKDRQRVKQIFKILIEDTQHHADLLKLIVEMGGG